MVDTTNATKMGRRSGEQFVATGIPRKCPYDLESASPMIQELALAYARAYRSAFPPRQAPNLAVVPD